MKDRFIIASLPNADLYNACVLSTLLYRAECWSLRARDEERLDAFDFRCQREILKVKWSQHFRNDNIRQKTRQPQLLNQDY